ncbi:MAG: branched-chain amino acid ABC transporter permease [Candidatus Cloacimonetes bacterium]|nr:branched-chain amino acid ABC transporter permease [Candidatus Cloacimonadota bacterium]
MPLIQIFLNVLIHSSNYVLIGISIALLYQTTRFLNFSIAAIYTSGSYFVFLFLRIFNFSLFLSIIFSIFFCVLIGFLIELFLFKKIRKKKSSYLISVLTSFGVYIILQNLISLIFGDSTKSIRSGAIKEGINIFGARITPVQIIIIITSIIITIFLLLFLKKTKIGKAMKAVANDAELANISGISSDKVISISFAIGSGLAGLAGILVALDVDMTPTMGMNALMMGVVAMIIGGVNSILGIVCGALLLSLAQNLGVWYFSSQWQDAIAFVVLLIFLIFRPQGFFGKKFGKANI